jgi:hypothetical protein
VVRIPKDAASGSTSGGKFLPHTLVTCLAETFYVASRVSAWHNLTRYNSRRQILRRYGYFPPIHLRCTRIDLRAAIFSSSAAFLSLFSSSRRGEDFFRLHNNFAAPMLVGSVLEPQIAANLLLSFAVNSG